MDFLSFNMILIILGILKILLVLLLVHFEDHLYVCCKRLNTNSASSGPSTTNNTPQVTIHTPPFDSQVENCEHPPKYEDIELGLPSYEDCCFQQEFSEVQITKSFTPAP